MELPEFLQSKQNTPADSLKQRLFADRKKTFSILGLVVLLMAIPLTVWLAQKNQIFAPKATSAPIELVAEEGSCVISTNPNKVNCPTFPVKLTSPLGPPAIASGIPSASPSPHVEPTHSPSPSAASSASPSPVASPSPSPTSITACMNSALGLSSPLTFANKNNTTIVYWKSPVTLTQLTSAATHCGAQLLGPANFSSAAFETFVRSNSGNTTRSVLVEGPCTSEKVNAYRSNGVKVSADVQCDEPQLDYKVYATTNTFDGIGDYGGNGDPAVVIPAVSASNGGNFFAGLLSRIINIAAPSFVFAQSNTLSDKLISYWKFDETSGDSVVDSKGVNNGTATGTTIIDGRFNKARQTGSSGYISAADNAAYSANNFTVGGWVKPTTFGASYASIFSRRTGGNIGMYLEYLGDAGAENGQLQCHLDLASGSVRAKTSGNNKLTAGDWNFTACSYDGTTLKIYINGSVAATATQTGVPNNPAGASILMGRNPINSTHFLNAGLDEVMYWTRALTDAEVVSLWGGALPDVTASPSPSPLISPSPSSVSSPSPSGSAGSSPSPASSDSASPSPSSLVSPSPEASSLPGTVSYKIAETEAGLATAEVKPYDSDPLFTDFTFIDTTPGAKQVWVEFIGADGSSRKEHIPVELVEPDPVLTSLDCSMDISKQNLKLTLNGSRLGTASGKVTANAKDAQILTWNATQVTATIKPDISLEDGQAFQVVLTKGDGKVFPAITCQVNTALIALGARLFCREPGKFDVNGVRVTLVDENGNKVNEEVTIDADGVIKGLKTKFQVGKPYALSIKAPFSLRRNAMFTAANGTNLVTPEEGSIFILPVGDIAPVILPDGKINTPDRAELVREWSVLGTNTSNGDFNRDTKVNSIDWACMRYDFNNEDDPIPANAALRTPAPTSLTPVVCPDHILVCPSGKTLVQGDPQSGNCPVYSCVGNSPSPQPSGQRLGYFLLEPVEGGSYPNDDEFIVNINIWSQHEAANLFVAKLSFDPTALEVVRTERGTTLTSWAEEFFDNTNGRISLVGGLPNPGLKTSEGNDPLMAKIIFKGKKTGTTAVSVTEDSKIYSNSDNSNILNTLLSAQIAITN